MKAELIKKRILSCISNTLFPPLCWMHKGIHLWYSLWEPSRASEGKSHRSVISPKDWILLEFLSQSYAHWASSNSSITVHSHPGTDPMEVSALVSCDSLYSPAGLSSLGDNNFLWCPTSLMNLRVTDFSVCSIFLLVRTEGQLPSFSHTQPETRSPPCVSSCPVG